MPWEERWDLVWDRNAAYHSHAREEQPGQRRKGKARYGNRKKSDAPSPGASAVDASALDIVKDRTITYDEKRPGRFVESVKHGRDKGFRCPGCQFEWFCYEVLGRRCPKCEQQLPEELQSDEMRKRPLLPGEFDLPPGSALSILATADGPPRKLAAAAACAKRAMAFNGSHVEYKFSDFLLEDVDARVDKALNELRATHSDRSISECTEEKWYKKDHKDSIRLLSCMCIVLTTCVILWRSTLFQALV